ncbi:MAG: glycerol-3-phosphate acyltransferase [Clostridia bacterium]|nr:glycerol-3-phosphate acyltransferase [Clostridia bacterium]
MDWGSVTALVLMGIAAYLIGAIPTGVLVGKWLRGINLQQEGSGNIGAANALDTMGPVPGLLVFAGDFGKGLLVLILTRALGFPREAELWMGFLAVTGHIFPVYLRFRGGKGLATGLAVALWGAPFAVLVFALLWAVVFLPTRYMPVSSLTGVLGVAVYAGIKGIPAGVCLGLLIAARHFPETWVYLKKKFSPGQ